MLLPVFIISMICLGGVKAEDPEIDISAIGMGNPHMVIHVDDLSTIQLEKWGPYLEKDDLFPSHTNVHFVQVISPHSIRILVWERGCGPTLACGTGACACLVATHLLGLCNHEIDVFLPGGKLHINWLNKNANIFMTGPALLTYRGEVDDNIFTTLS